MSSGGDLDAGLRQRLEESAIEPNDWHRWAPLVDAVCRHNGVRPIDLDACSVGDLYQLPTYPPYRAEEFAIGVLAGSALLFAREKGIFKKKPEFRVIELEAVGAAQFWPDDQQLGTDWGSCDVQAGSQGGQPVFRLGWGWGSVTSVAMASRERDRILQFLTSRRRLQRPVEERQATREGAMAYLAIEDGRFLPLAVSVADAEQLLTKARERGDEMVSFPSATGGTTVQLVQAITHIAAPKDVGHQEARPESAP